ncbi:hypothetical protein RFI_14914 [Reticulomyxa filosa]|uniref:Uncharacterized protein n=1 Tax=Reticulomyxa filosa TaxID=46433 RepID=X6N8B0_RETFI|nr:hypothetical protein RFI_14914 [Reticulomyxa filosa]|eukprot:ETO22286.1 hypothetical protein RFI_14914 [Reticulomyxa filosa]
MSGEVMSSSLSEKYVQTMSSPRSNSAKHVDRSPFKQALSKSDPSRKQRTNDEPTHKSNSQLCVSPLGSLDGGEDRSTISPAQLTKTMSQGTGANASGLTRSHTAAFASAQSAPVIERNGNKETFVNAFTFPLSHIAQESKKAEDRENKEAFALSEKNREKKVLIEEFGYVQTIKKLETEIEREMKEENKKILTRTNDLKHAINENLWSATQSLRQLRERFHSRANNSSFDITIKPLPHPTTSSVKSKINKKQKKLKLSQLPKCLNEIPKKMCRLWRSNVDNEVNRFSKLSRHSHYISTDKDYSNIDWDERIATDIMRAGKLFVDGEIHEIFEFPRFKSPETRMDLVKASIKYLESAVCHLIISKVESVDKDTALALSQKTVKQAMISLCQDFVNDPYFRFLKEACNEWNLQPVDLGLKLDDNNCQALDQMDSWTPRLVIEIHGQSIFTHVCRIFQIFEMKGVEAMETDFILGFKRTYEIDMFSKPPKILPPTFMSQHKHIAMIEVTVPIEKCDADVVDTQANNQIGDFMPHSP